MKTEVLVIGGGAAGLRAAIEARRQGLEVWVLSTFKVGYGNNSAISLGGFSATAEEDDRDSPALFYEDTMKSGCWVNRPFLVRLLVERAWAEAKELEGMGVQFLREPGGKYIRLGRGGHSVARRLATPGNSGMALLTPLLKYGQRLDLTFLNGVKVVRILQQDSQVSGVLLIDRQGEWSAISAKSVILATGGCAALYPETSNVSSATGDGYALAYEAGLPLQDMEFVQFVLRHVTEPGVPRRVLPVESLLLKGATLRNPRGEGLQEGGRARPSFTRDAISQAVGMEIARNEGNPGYAFLDLKTIPEAERKQIPGLEKDVLKVFPISHFFMGGIRVEDDLRTPVAGLYVAGEVMGGLHGANRLGGNALAETFVFGSLAGSLAACFAKGLRKGQPLECSQAQKAAEELTGQFGNQRENILELEKELKAILGECAGVIRKGEKMVKGLNRLGKLQESFAFLSPYDPQGLWPAFTFRHKLVVTEMILKSALKREETRGAHYRIDFPSQDDHGWRVNVCLRRNETGQMKLFLEPVVHPS